MKKNKQLFIVAMLAASAEVSAVQEGQGIGNGFPLPKGDVATRSKTIANNFYEGLGGGGEIVSNVNAFNLTSVYSVPLGAITQRGQTSFSVNLGYSGNIWAGLVSDNDKAPTLPVALGWGYSIPNVSVNHRGTLASMDDIVFCDLGPFGGGQLLQKMPSGEFFLSGNPAIKIEAVVNTNSSSVLFERIESWAFTMPGGQKLFFGDAGDGVVSNSERIVMHDGHTIQASPFNLGVTKPFIYRWDIRMMTDPPAYGQTMGSNRLYFEYAKTNYAHSASQPTKAYTQQSHISKIYNQDVNNNEFESLRFTYSAAPSRFYSGYASDESTLDQRLFVSSSLDKVEYFKNGIVCQRITLNYPSEIAEGTAINQNRSGAKRLLSSVQIEVEHNGAMVNHGAYSFTYQTGNHLNVGNLLTATSPDGRKTEFAVEPNEIAPAAPNVEMKDAATGARLLLPGDPNTLDNLWGIRTSCSDRFCYVIVTSKQKVDNGKTFLEIYHNTGKYWNTSTPVIRRTITSAWPNASNWADQINVVPMGDRYLVTKRYEATVEIWDWNGEAFSLSQTLGPFPFSSTISGRENEIGISVFPASNYMLIHRRSAGVNSQNISHMHVFLRNPGTGIWQDLTTDANCQVNNSNNHGEQIKDPATNKCFEFANASGEGSKWIHASVSDKMFVVVEGTKGILFPFVLNGAGSGFDALAGNIVSWNDGQDLHDINHPNNLSNHVVKEPIFLSNDYFVLKTRDGFSGTGNSRLHVFHFDGASIQMRASDALQQDNVVSGSAHHNLRVWTTNEYFLTANLRGDIGGRYIKYWRKTGTTSSISFPVTNKIPDPNIGDGVELVVETHPRSFFVGYYRNGTVNEAFPSLPPHTYTVGSLTDYRTYLFKINQNGVADLLTDSEHPRDDNGRKYVQIWFSPADNVLIARSLFANGPVACGPEGNCLQNYDSYPFFPNLSPNSNFTSSSDRSRLPEMGSGLAHYSHVVQSTFPSLFARAKIIRETSTTNWASVLLLSSGPYRVGFGNSPRVRSVSSYVDPAGTEKLTTTFDAAPFSTRIYNRRTGNIDHSEVIVTPGTGAGSFRYLFTQDEPTSPLSHKTKDLSGSLKKLETHRNSGSFKLKSTMTNSFHPPFHLDAWPTNLWVNRLQSTTQTETPPSGGAGISTTHNYIRYQDETGAPMFTSQSLAGNRWRVNQTIFNGANLPVQGVTYELSDITAATAEMMAYPSNGTAPFRNLGALSSSKSEYQPALPFFPYRSFAWRDQGTSPTNADQPLSDAELRAGTPPVYKLDRGFHVLSEVTRVNSFNQVVESKILRTAQNTVYNTVNYEGRGSWPVASFSNCRADNCAAFLCENGELGTAALDLPTPVANLPSVPGPLPSSVHRWANDGGAYDDTRSHTGKYSLRVTNAWGARIDLFLKDVPQGFDYVASVWMYATPGSSPLLLLSRRGAAGAEVDAFPGAPVDGSIVFNKWQRWEVKVTNAQLRAGGLFGGTNDFVRLTAGAPDGGTVYVDDFVCRPAHSEFVIRSFDSQGRPTSETDSRHLSKYFEYGYLGNVVATRNEEFKIFGQAGSNRLGENP